MCKKNLGSLEKCIDGDVPRNGFDQLDDQDAHIVIQVLQVVAFEDLPFRQNFCEALPVLGFSGAIAFPAPMKKP